MDALAPEQIDPPPAALGTPARGLAQRCRVFMQLARPGMLVTVWSNAIAGWWLGGGGNSHAVPWALAGVTLVYLGGALLNDAFDAEFDSLHHPLRPVPSRAVPLKLVWRLGLALLAAGALLLATRGPLFVGLGMALVVAAILYNAGHHLAPVGVGAMAACRLLVYLLAAAAGSRGITGAAMWGGLVVAAYAAGVEVFASDQPDARGARFWPVWLLLVPIALALIVNVDEYREPAWLLCLALAIWIVYAMRQVYAAGSRNSSRGVGALLAGIVFADWVAAVTVPRRIGFVFLALFVAAALASRWRSRVAPDAGTAAK